jgi:hypothetical protein
MQLQSRWRVRAPCQQRPRVTETAILCGGGVPMEIAGGGAMPGNGTRWRRQADVVGENGKGKEEKENEPSGF